MPRFNSFPPPALVAEGLSKVYGTTTAVDGLTLTINAGEIFGFLGPSRAGKTTAMRMLAGLLPPTSGRAIIAGFDVTNPAYAPQVRSTIGFLPEGHGADPEMTVPELLDYFVRLKRVLGEEHAARIEAILSILHGVDGQADRAAQQSASLRQRLALARVLTHNPSIVFLDEPTAHLAPEAADTMFELIRSLRAQGRTVVLTTQLREEAERLCDRVAVLDTRILTVGTPSELHGALPAGVSRASGRAALELVEVNSANVQCV